MHAEPTLLLALDLTGTFVFGLNGALTAVRAARLDVVGVVTLGMMTALGGGVIRDVLIGSIPPATFLDWRYFALAAAGGLIAFALSKRLSRLETPITVLDAIGLSVFAVIGASKAMNVGLGIAPSVLLGVVTAVGGGTIRDTLVRQIPTVLRSELYAIPALVAAAITVATMRMGLYGLPAALGAAAVCFVIRMIGVRFGLNAPSPPGTVEDSGDPESDPPPASGPADRQ
ncbi:trimeric intracellular cation channel family protein [Mycobacterium hodleri]|uniref:trimeric intracellular cation channel family protein n=1 Tax=Mycolicibacterium hodleri TaxID=49897 RepID=UPI0021F3B703|nr:trimeric intracellular cation channel family protein [Mycolicibacterium hodleri]MCV7132430.1 trimeric intracellular cation channel family protein [Mycolicibacterium hodleri]